MGRNALLLVMGVGFAFGTIRYSINTVTAEGLQSNWSYYKAMNAHKLAKTAIHTALHTYDMGDTPVVHQDIQYAGGTFRITELKTDTAPYDTVWIAAEGTYEDTTAQLFCTLRRETQFFPNVPGALGVRGQPALFSLKGNPEIDGRNYTADGSSLVNSGDVPGVSVMTTADSWNLYVAAGLNLTQKIKGAPAIEVDPTIPEPADYFDDYLAKADYVLTQTLVNGNKTYGSSAAPVIVVCDDPSYWNYSVKFSGNVKGYGILVVRGNVEFSGTSQWNGLVLVTGKTSSVSFKMSGTASIVGGVILGRGTNGSASVSYSGNGNKSKLKYSSEALANARSIGKLQSYSIVDWYE
ncbi:MAG: hypothetical protein L0Y80_05950 [Ignavibacteriae bacterium]|nr:hypothetical protein [Ignavibacteriota bacterium]